MFDKVPKSESITRARVSGSQDAMRIHDDEAIIVHKSNTSSPVENAANLKHAQSV
jgi:hypothetical protein